MRLRASVTALLLFALAATLLAQVIRDRALWLALVMFVPVWPLAVCAVGWDGLWRGHALPRRWLLSTIGLVAGGLAVALMWTPARPSRGSVSQQTLTVLHWNTQWGGTRGEQSLTEIVQVLEARDADIYCLSEAPEPALLQRSWGQRRPGLHSASVQHAETDSDWYRLTVVSRFPVAVRRQWTLPIGRAALFELALESRALRILVVDLRSAPLLPRSASIRKVADIVEQLARDGMEVQLVAGDFNTPGRFLGFDALADAGYERAALWSGQWRGTWPSNLPWSPYDIDHLWVGSGLQVVRAEIFSSDASDHRAQMAWLRR